MHWSAVDVWHFTEADWDTTHYLVVAKVRKRLSVSKWAAWKSDMERFNFKNLNDVEVKDQYQDKIPSRFVVLENMDDDDDDDVDISKAWESIRI